MGVESLSGSETAPNCQFWAETSLKNKPCLNTLTPIHFRIPIIWSFAWHFHIYKYGTNCCLILSPTPTYPHITPALLTVCVKWGCRYFRVRVASLLRRESPLSFPPWLRSPFSPCKHSGQRLFLLLGISMVTNGWLSVWWRTVSLEARMLP